MFNQFTIAYVYAKSIFDIALNQNDINTWRSIIELFSKITQDDTIRSLSNNLLNPKKLSKILIDIYQNYKKEKLHTFGKRFINVITENNRISLLPVILKIFNNLYHEHVKSIQIEIISARKLNNNQLKKITEIMTHRLSKKIKIISHINKEIIAGIIIRIEDIVIDGSLRGRISRLNNILQS